MKFCSKCGKEILDEAVICVHCGCAVQNSGANNLTTGTTVVEVNEANESSTLSTCALVFSFLMPIVGLILGIVGACKYKTSSYKTSCISAIILSIFMWLLSFSVLLLISSI